MKSSPKDDFYHAGNEKSRPMNVAKGERPIKFLAKSSTITRLFSLNLSSTRTTGDINGLAVTSSGSHLSSDTEGKISLEEALGNSARYLQESLAGRKNSRLHLRKSRPFDSNSSDKEERPPSGPAQKAKSIFHRPANHRPSIPKTSDVNTANKLFRNEIVFSSQNSNSKVLNYITAASQRFTDLEALLPTSKFFLEGGILRFHQYSNAQEIDSHVAPSSGLADARDSRDEDAPKETVASFSVLFELALSFVRENVTFTDSPSRGIKILMSSTSFSVLFNELAPMLKGYYRNSIFETMGVAENLEAPGENIVEMVKKDFLRALRSILHGLLKEIMDLTVKESTSFFYSRQDSTERDDLTRWSQYWCQLIEIWTFFNHKIRYQALCSLHSLEVTVVLGGWFPNYQDESSGRFESCYGVDNILLLSFGETIIMPAMHTWQNEADEETRNMFFVRPGAKANKVLHMLKACLSSVDSNASYFKQLDQSSYGAFQDFTRHLDRVLISQFAPSSPAQQISYS